MRQYPVVSVQHSGDVMLFPITDEVVDRQRARFHEHGIVPTPRHLYYAVCAAVEAPTASIAAGQIGLGAMLLVIAVLLPWRLWQIGVAAAGACVLLIGMRSRILERRRPKGRVLATSFEAFMKDFLAGGDDLPGHEADLLHPETWHPSGFHHGCRIIVCDTDETAALLAGNRKFLEGDYIVCKEDSLAGIDPALSPDRILVFHDATPEGCSLPGIVRALPSCTKSMVIDCGLRPNQDLALRLPCYEGAPLQLPEGPPADVHASEWEWLREGHRAEVSALSLFAVKSLIRTAEAMPYAGDMTGVLWIPLPEDLSF